MRGTGRWLTSRINLHVVQRHCAIPGINDHVAARGAAHGHCHLLPCRDAQPRLRQQAGRGDGECRLKGCAARSHSARSSAGTQASASSSHELQSKLLGPRGDPAPPAAVFTHSPSSDVGAHRAALLATPTPRCPAPPAALALQLVQSTNTAPQHSPPPACWRTRRCCRSPPAERCLSWARQQPPPHC